MNTFALVVGAGFGILGIILGAFGAHAFKKKISAEKLASFEVGVRYQMYSALVLLLIGFNCNLIYLSELLAVYAIVTGTVLFSVSIYLLSFAAYWKKNLRFLGPITPLGGFLMIVGWVALMLSFLRN